jgi:hypothetical protein
MNALTSSKLMYVARRSCQAMLLLSLPVRLGACGVMNTSHDVPTVTADKASASALVAQTQQLRTSLQNHDSASVAAEVQLLALVGPMSVASGASGSSTRGAQTIAGAGGGTASCDASGCTYTNYRDSSNDVTNGQVLIQDNGASTTISINLSIQTVGSSISAGDTFVWTTTGALTLSPNAVDGDLKAETKLSASGYAYDYYEELRYNQVVIDSAGKPVSGSLYAKWAISIAGLGGFTEGYEATAVFP